METQDLPPLKFDTRIRYHIAKTCPCGKSNRDGKFVPYVGHDDKGYCHSCDKTYLPEVDRTPVSSFQTLRERKPETPPSYIKPEVLKASLKAYESNKLVQFLIQKFGTETVEKTISKYLVGTTRNGDAIFWQVDAKGHIRTGHIMKYDLTGHRLKDDPTTWAHTEMRLKDYKVKQCLYGEHLLRGNTLPTAVVESEKTAIISSIYFPDYVWVASAGASGLSIEKMRVLQGRKVILFPDIQGFAQWQKRAKELSPMLDIKVSDLLERKATQGERSSKLDIADYLLRFQVEDFIKPENAALEVLPKPTEPYYETLSDGKQILMHPAGFPLSWDVPMNSLTEKLIHRLGCEFHNEQHTGRPWDEVAGKPLFMPYLTIEQFRANNWRHPPCNTGEDYANYIKNFKSKKHEATN